MTGPEEKAVTVSILAARTSEEVESLREFVTEDTRGEQRKRLLRRLVNQARVIDESIVAPPPVTPNPARPKPLSRFLVRAEDLIIIKKEDFEAR